MKVTKELWKELTAVCWTPCEHSKEMWGKDVCMGVCPFCLLEKGLKILVKHGALVSFEEAFREPEEKVN